MLGIGDGKVAAEKFWPRSEIHDAAVGVETPADARAPAIAQVDRASQPGFGRRNRRRGVAATVASLLAASAGGGLAGGGACGAGVWAFIGGTMIGATSGATIRRTSGRPDHFRQVPIHVTSVDLPDGTPCEFWKRGERKIVKRRRHHADGARGVHRGKIRVALETKQAHFRPCQHSADC